MRSSATELQGRGRRPLHRALALAALAILVSGGCDNLLEVDDPDVLKPPQLEGPESVPLLVNAARSDFQSAFNGPFNLSLVSVVGLMTDEYINSETFFDRIEIDQRSINRNDNAASAGLFGMLQVARTSAGTALEGIDEFAPDHADRPLMLTYRGYADLYLGEVFCAGVPVSRLEGNEIVFGEPRTTAQIFQDALAAFDAALADDPGFALARVGKGRALLGLGRPAEAAAAVAGVPTGFVGLVHHSTTQNTVQGNGLWGFTGNGRLSVADAEAGEGLPFRTAGDPRVPWVDTNTTGFDGDTRLFLQLIAPDQGSDMVFSSGVEARLIEAEAALAGGQSAAYLPVLNALRADAGLEPLADPGTPAGRVDQLFRERAFWLYSQGTRLGDMRRLIRQYGRDAGTVFPTGAYHKGGVYGPDVNIPIPVAEDNNPNTRNLESGCLDREA